MAASYTARMLAGAGDPFVLAVPAGEFRYFMPAIGAEDVVVGMSASGEFRDVIAVFEQLHGKCPWSGITHVPGSSISKLADHLLVSAGGPSRVPVMTKTYASTLTALHLLLLEIFSAAPAYFDDLAASADRCEQALAQAKKLLPDLVPVVGKIRSCLLLRRRECLCGLAGGRVENERDGSAACRRQRNLGNGLRPGHGRLGKDLLRCPLYRRPKRCFHLESPPAWRTNGAHVSWMSGRRRWPVTFTSRCPAPTYPAFASLSLVPPLALLAYRVARARGQNPNQPAWRERYYSQGMTHILGE